MLPTGMVGKFKAKVNSARWSYVALAQGGSKPCACENRAMGIGVASTAEGPGWAGGSIKD